MNRLIQFTLLALMAGLFVGCGNGLPSMKEYNSLNIQKAHMFYRNYMAKHNMRGPANMNDLLEFLRTDNNGKLAVKRMEVDPDKLDEIFVSERDGEPFKIRWNLKGIDDFPIVFEAYGVEDMRLVALTPVREVDKEDWEGYWSGRLKGASAPNRAGESSKVGGIIEPELNK